MKLLLGHPMKKSGHLTVDIFGTPDLVHDLNTFLPLQDECVEQIESYHLLEHLKPSTIDKVILDWKRVLIPQGKVILETPDCVGVMKNYLAGQDKGMMLKYLFGNQERKGQIHYWIYSQESLNKLFSEKGFECLFTEPQDYHRTEAPCLRLEATKL